MNGLGDDLQAIVDSEQQSRDHRDLVDVAICTPDTLLFRAATLMGETSLGIGGQNCHSQQSGAFTGDCSAAMIKDAGARLVIVGHSERRDAHNESSEDVKSKAEAALTEGLVVVVCVGEPDAVRTNGEGAAFDFVGAQVVASLPDGGSAATVVLAYEPIWAIGTGNAATPADIDAMHAHIRTCLPDHYEPDIMRLLYGGSVKGSNAADIFALDNVDGALVGGASLKADDFAAITGVAYRGSL